MGKKVKIAAFLILMASSLSAQWRINLVVNPRPPRKISEWRKRPGIVSLTVTYTGPGEREAIIRAEIRGERFSEILSGESNPIMFRSGVPVNLDNARMVNWDEVRYSTKFQRIVARTGNLPSDVYEICVGVYEPGSRMPSASRCATFEITAPSPPRLLSPHNGDTVSVMGLTFRWTPVVAYPPTVPRYRIRIWEFRRRDNIKRAMSRPPVFERVVTTTTLRYPLRAPRLETGGRYIWAVQAIDQNGEPIGTNNGMSEVWGFVVGREAPGIRLPRVLKVGNFIVTVSSYDAGSRLSSLSGTGRAFFYNEETGNRVWFPVAFNGLVGETRIADTVVIARGTVVSSFSRPLILGVAGFTYHITDVTISPDSAVANLFMTHPCLFDTGSAEPWQLGPFETKIDTDGAFVKTISSTNLKPFRMADLDIYFKLTGNVTIDMAARTLGGSTGGDTTGGSSGGSGGSSGGLQPIRPGVIVGPQPGGTIPGLQPPPALQNPILIPGLITLPELVMWRGVVFDSGYTIPRNDMVYSNIGYLYGKYSFGRAVLTDSGLTVRLNPLENYWHFTTVAPYGYQFELVDARIDIKHCRVKDGYLKGQVRLPEGKHGLVTWGNDPIDVDFDSLTVDSTMAFYGTGQSKAKAFLWGEYELIHPGYLHFRFTSEPRKYYPVVSGDTFTVSYYTDTLVGMLLRVGEADTLIVRSPDVHSPRLKIHGKTLVGWLVLDEQGVSGRIWLGERTGEYFKGAFGRPGRQGYLSDSTFAVRLFHNPQDSMEFYMEFVGNSVFDSRLDGIVRELPQPTGIKFEFRRMNLTSVAQLVGGKINFSQPETLDYWGVTMDCKTGYMSVRTGEAVFTDASVSEPVHFSQPFNIIWGQISADGAIKRMDFNQNSAYQTFDGFPITLDSAGLSQPRASDKYGALVVRTYVHFQFFGQPDTTITIFDYRYDSTQSPYKGRFVRIDSPAVFRLQREWGNRLVDFDLKEVTYDTIRQYGFMGSGSMDIDYLNKSLYLAADLESDGIQMCINDSTTTSNVIMAGQSVTSITNIWGCAYIEGNSLRRIVIGGYLTHGAVSLIGSVSGATSRLTLAITPTVTKLTVEGRFELKEISDAVEMDAYARLVHNRGQNYLEGDIYGMFMIGAGLPLESDNAYVMGRFTFHLGLDYTAIQGEGSINIDMAHGLLTGMGAGIQGGFFVGVNVPKNKAWILTHRTGRFGVNMSNLPSTLTGFYAYVDVQTDVDLLLFGGGIEIFLGIGAMQNGVGSASACAGLPLPYVIGDFGIYVYGEILEGLLSASGSFEGQFIGPCPFAIEGTIRLKGCVLWVACADIHLTVGISSQKGVYIE